MFNAPLFYKYEQMNNIHTLFTYAKWQRFAISGCSFYGCILWFNPFPSTNARLGYHFRKIVDDLSAINYEVMYTSDNYGQH